MTYSDDVKLKALPAPKGSLPEKLRPILDGMLLGDLCLHLPRGRINARAEWNGKYLEIAEAIVRELPLPGGWVGPRKVIHHVLGKEYSSYHLYSHCLPMLTEQYHRWYPSGGLTTKAGYPTKRVPRDIDRAGLLAPDTIYWWYIGDGSLTKRHGCIIFHTEGFTREDVKFLCLCPLKAWEARIHNHYGKPRIYIPRRHVDSLLEYIGPCRNPKYQYKWGCLL